MASERRDAVRRRGVEKSCDGRVRFQREGAVERWGRDEREGTFHPAERRRGQGGEAAGEGDGLGLHPASGTTREVRPMAARSAAV
jgi:hypothetical protein